MAHDAAQWRGAAGLPAGAAAAGADADVALPRTLSSAEAEYFGATLAAKEAIWLRELLTDLGLLVPGPTIMWCDSKSAVEMAFDPVAFKKTKHIPPHS